MGPDPSDRARAALFFVQKRLRYQALSFGEGGYVPRSINSIWDTGYGDCKDASYLFVAVVREHIALGPRVNSPARYECRTDHYSWRADELRDRLANEGITNVSQQYVKCLRTTWTDVVETFPLQIIDDEELNCITTIETYEIPAPWCRTGDGGRFEINDLFIRPELQPLPLGVRKNDIDLGRPRNLRRQITVDLPRNWGCEPWDEIHEADGVRYTSKMASEGRKRFVLKQELTISAQTAPASSIDQYCHIILRLRETGAFYVRAECNGNNFAAYRSKFTRLVGVAVLSVWAVVAITWILQAIARYTVPETAADLAISLRLYQAEFANAQREFELTILSLRPIIEAGGEYHDLYDKLSPAVRYRVDSGYGWAAFQLRLPADAHRAYIRASQSSLANVNDWFLRYQAAKLENDFTDVLATIRVMTTRWPDWGLLMADRDVTVTEQGLGTIENAADPGPDARHYPAVYGVTVLPFEPRAKHPPESVARSSATGDFQERLDQIELIVLPRLKILDGFLVGLLNYCDQRDSSELRRNARAWVDCFRALATEQREAILAGKGPLPDIRSEDANEFLASLIESWLKTRAETPAG